MSQARYTIKRSADGLWYWILVAANGEIIATSETYETEQGAKKGIRAVRRIALVAPVKYF